MSYITFQFSTSDSLIDKIIKVRTDSDIAHVDVITQSGKLLGAQLSEPAAMGGPGVQIRPANYENWAKRIRVTIQVDDQQALDFWHSVLSQQGKKYDVLAILGLGFHRNWRNTNKWFCSELQAWACEQAKILQIDQNVNWVDPQTLLELLCASKYFFSKEVISGNVNG